MKTSLKTITLVALFTATLGLASFSGGCAATATRQSTGEYIDDSSTTAKVKAAFVKDPIVKAIDVKVETLNGVVMLGGAVNTNEEKAQAGRLAALVTGVTDVRNNITVK